MYEQYSPPKVEPKKAPATPKSKKSLWNLKDLPKKRNVRPRYLDFGLQHGDLEGFIQNVIKSYSTISGNEKQVRPMTPLKILNFFE